MLCVEGDADSESAVTMQAAAKGFGKQKLHEMKYFSLGGGHEELVEWNTDQESTALCKACEFYEHLRTYIRQEPVYRIAADN